MSDVMHTDKIDWDNSGALSVVVQGGLFENNLLETARNCQHWRQLVPNAQIILAISVTDILDGLPNSGVIERLRLTRKLAHDRQLVAMIKIIQASCDLVVLAEAAVALPSIKTVSDRPNNANLQIAAAKCALDLATGHYILRIRSDLVFPTRTFLAQYEEGLAMPRGPAAVLRSRVMISWLYTLNPYTIERMPLHYSDWFNLGLRDDVKALWDIPYMSLQDAVHYRAHPHARYANAEERQILPRLAVEQFIAFNGLKPFIPDLVLDYHVDLTSRELAVDILVDNFIICDVGEAGALFKKQYEADFFNPAKRIHCVTRADWCKMASGAYDQRHAVLSVKNIHVQHPEQVPMPREYDTSELMIVDAVRNRNEIVATAKSGLISHGPYATIPKGDYTATFSTIVLRGSGSIALTVTTNEGEFTIAQRDISIVNCPDGDLKIDFSIETPIGFGVEVLCHCNNIDELVITGLMITEQKTVAPVEEGRLLNAASDRLLTNVGLIRGTAFVTDARAGALIYGPYMTLMPGRYCVRFQLGAVIEPSGCIFEISHNIDKVIVQVEVSTDLESFAVIEEYFMVDEEISNVEFRCWVGKESDLVIENVFIQLLLE